MSKTGKDVDDPISGQTYALSSIVLFETPKKVGNNVYYGIIKQRGNFASKRDSELFAKELAENDPKNTILTSLVGHWTPISRIPISADTTTIGSEDKKFSPDSEANKQLLKEQNRKIQEIKEREAELKEQSEQEDGQTIEGYIKKRNVVNTLFEDIENAKNTIANLTEKLEKYTPLLLDMEVLNPEFIETWQEVYAKELKKVNLPPKKELPSFLEYLHEKRNERVTRSV